MHAADAIDVPGLSEAKTFLDQLGNASTTASSG
jgi:hypothetical protein